MENISQFGDAEICLFGVFATSVVDVCGGERALPLLSSAH